jgi:hypothetical protein
MKEHRLRVFENRVRGKVFGSRKDEVTKERRRLQNGIFVVSTPHQISVKLRRMRYAEHEQVGGRRYGHTGLQRGT